jgi:hypothetical protein
LKAIHFTAWRAHSRHRLIQTFLIHFRYGDLALRIFYLILHKISSCRTYEQTITFRSLKW